MPRDPLEPKVLPKISVVICTFNRHDMLLEAIMSIELQDLPRQEYELIIVDNSDDLQARDRFRDGLQITCAHRYLDEARPGLSRARNIGIHAARAELVAFLDDDAKASAGWLRHIIEAFSTNEAAGVVGGPVRPIWAARCPDWLTPRLQSFLTIIDRGDEARLLAGEEWLSGTNIAFRTRAVTEADLFPENLGRIRGLLLSKEELLVTNAYEISATRYSTIQRSKCIIASIPIGSASPGCDAGCFASAVGSLRRRSAAVMPCRRRHPADSGFSDETGRATAAPWDCFSTPTTRSCSRRKPRRSVRWLGCWRPTVRIGAAFSRKAGNSVGGVPLRPRPVDDAAAAA